VSVPLELTGLKASTRDGRIRQAISCVLALARTHGAGAVVIEDLDFVAWREEGRERSGRRPSRGKRAKGFRRLVAGLPTGKFRDRLVQMAANNGVAVIAVDPAYTSRWGAEHWLEHLGQISPEASGHHAAALVIGRRGLGHRARRRERCECAGINRHGEGDERALRRRGSDPRRPRVMRRRPQGRRRSVDRGTCRLGYRTSNQPGPGCRRFSHKRKATPPVAPSRAAGGPCGVGEPTHARNLHAREPEVPCPPGWLITSRAAQARPRPQS